jgi:uncharacterized protein YdaL
MVYHVITFEFDNNIVNRESIESIFFDHHFFVSIIMVFIGIFIFMFKVRNTEKSVFSENFF